MSKYVQDSPVLLWRASIFCHQHGARLFARMLKGVNFLLFRAVLPPEVRLGNRVALGHYGLNVVVHPNVDIGDDVRLWHNVTIAVSDSPGSATRITIGDRVTIGAGAVIVSRERSPLNIASDINVGANAVVARSLGESGTYVGIPARLVV